MDNIKRNAFELIRDLIDYAQRKEIVSAEKSVIQVKFGEKIGELVLTDEGRRKARELADRILEATGRDFNLARQFLNEFKEERKKVKSELRQGKTIDDAYRQSPEYQTEVLMQRLSASLNLKLRHEEKKTVNIANPRSSVRPAQMTETITPSPVYKPEATSYTPVYRPAEHVVSLPQAVPTVQTQTDRFTAPVRPIRVTPQPEIIVKRKQGLFSRFKTFVTNTIEKVKSYFVQPEVKPYQIAQHRQYQRTYQPATQSLPELKISPQVKRAVKNAVRVVKNEASRLGNNAIPAVMGFATASLAMNMASNLDGYAPFFGRPELNNVGVQLGVNALALGVLGAATLLQETDFKKGLRLLPKRITQYGLTAGTQSLLVSLLH